MGAEIPATFAACAIDRRRVPPTVRAADGHDDAPTEVAFNGRML